MIITSHIIIDDTGRSLNQLKRARLKVSVAEVLTIFEAGAGVVDETTRAPISSKADINAPSVEELAVW